MTRPSADVVVPFRGAAAELEQLRRRLSDLRLEPGDSLVVVDNTPGTRPPSQALREGVAVVHAAATATPGFARNHGAALGGAEWIVFLDADTLPTPDLLERYFEPLPGARTGILAGGVADERVPAAGPMIPRYSFVTGSMSHDRMLDESKWGFPMTANAAFRRDAFESVGGFREDIRAAEDADLTYRLKDAGWGLERREGALVVHRSRQSLSGFLAQKLRWGAGAAWLAGEHPGAFPPRRLPGLLWWGVRTALAGLVRAGRDRDRDAGLVAVLEPLEQISYEVGRLLPNRRPLPAASLWTRLRSSRIS